MLSLIVCAVYKNPAYLAAIWRDTISRVELCSSPTEWAEQHVYIPATASARSGRFDVSLTPYSRDIMDACSIEDPCRRVVVMGSNQIGKTVAFLNVIGYRMHQWPVPMMIVLPRNEDVKEFALSRVDQFIASCPALAALAGTTELETKGADSVAMKSFPGGSLFIRGSQSEATFRSDPIGVILLDDLDAFARHSEGSHTVLAERRLNTYNDYAPKLIEVSSPTIAGTSRIASSYKDSSQRLYHVPCLTCGAYQVLWFQHMRWINDDPNTAHFVCQHCEAAMLEHHKPEMLAAGQWIAQRPERDTTVKGFWIWAAYAPSAFRTWAGMAQSYMEAARKLKDNLDTEPMQATLNLDWAEEFVLPGQTELEGIEREVYDRREPVFHAESLPIVVHTAGIDVQKNRIELTRVGWGEKNESWRIEHKVMKGSPESDLVWDQLAALLIGWGVGAACVDAGDWADQVCDQCTRIAVPVFRAGCVLYAIKGMPGKGQLWPGFVPPGNMKDARFRPVSIRVDAGKDWLYGTLSRVKTPGPGYIHLDHSVEKKYMKQLFAERERGAGDSKKGGRYIKIQGRNRNEALDCFVYARAAVCARATLDPNVRIMVFGEQVGETQKPAKTPAAKLRPGPANKKKSSWISRGVL